MTSDDKRSGKSEEVEQGEQPNEFEAVKTRLEQIADAVGDENISLDEALDLYEEAVSLGLQASDLLEVGVSPEEEPLADEDSPAAGRAESPAGSAGAAE